MSINKSVRTSAHMPTHIARHMCARTAAQLSLHRDWSKWVKIAVLRIKGPSTHVYAHLYVRVSVHVDAHVCAKVAAFEQCFGVTPPCHPSRPNRVLTVAVLS